MAVAIVKFWKFNMFRYVILYPSLIGAGLATHERPNKKQATNNKQENPNGQEQNRKLTQNIARPYERPCSQQRASDFFYFFILTSFYRFKRFIFAKKVKFLKN